MARARIRMKQLRKILEYAIEANLSLREVSALTGISKTTIGEYVSRFRHSGLTYAESTRLSDKELLTCFENRKETDLPEYKTLVAQFPDYAVKLKKKGMTRQFLWEKYKAENPDGYSYTQFCHYFTIWRNTLDVSMHQSHEPGDKAFLDYAGTTFPYHDRCTGKEEQAQIFVAILGASSLTYVEASKSQMKEDFIRSTERALRYFGGVPRALVPDNLKSAVVKASKYEPELNPLFDDFAEYYRTAIIPARAYRPKDKALVENAVKLTYQRIFAPLYGKSFSSLDDLNTAIKEQLERHNNRNLSKLGISRRQLFEQIERTELKTLPSAPYPLKYFESRKVAPDYHVLLSADRHYYSVPWHLKGSQVKVIYDENSVAIYADNNRIAQHERDTRPGGYTTSEAHMPRHHQFYNSWSAEKFTNWAIAIGEETSLVISSLLSSKKHEQQAYKSCVGILSLAKTYSAEDLNLACRRAWNHHRISYRDIKLYLEDIVRTRKLNREDKQISMFSLHENLRNSAVYR